MKREKTDFPVRTVATIFVIVLALGAIIGFIWGALMNAEYFKVRDIIAREASAVDFSYLRGKNIFSIDVKKEARYIQQYYPDCSKVTVVRVLPCRVFIDCIKRRPVAIVKLYRNFAVDELGTIFYIQVQEGDLGLPLIAGLETKIFGPKPGQRYTLKELNVALTIIKEFNKIKLLKNFQIRKIDTANLQNVSMVVALPASVQAAQDPAKPQEKVLPAGFEVKIGPDNIKERIAILVSVLVQAKNDLRNIKYIDLRFKDPVIKFIDAKTK